MTNVIKDRVSSRKDEGFVVFHYSNLSPPFSWDLSLTGGRDFFMHAQ